MSKAFTREDDDLPELPILTRPAAVGPEGARKVITPEGLTALRERLQELLTSYEALESKAGKVLAARIAELQETIASVVVLPMAKGPSEQVRFGSAVTIRDQDGEEACYRIVGSDEANPGSGDISLHSPLARALLDAKLGERVVFQSPAGEQAVTVLKIAGGSAASA